MRQRGRPALYNTQYARHFVAQALKILRQHANEPADEIPDEIGRTVWFGWLQETGRRGERDFVVIEPAERAKARGASDKFTREQLIWLSAWLYDNATTVGRVRENPNREPSDLALLAATTYLAGFEPVVPKKYADPD